MIRKIFESKSGFTLVEVLVGTAILALVGVGMLTALTTATKARFQADVRTTSVTIAETTIEAVKNQNLEYIFAPNTLSGADYTDVWLAIKDNYPANFEICTLDNNSTEVANKIYGLPWDLDTNTLVYGGPNPSDPGIQKITIIVKFDGKEIFRLADFKVNRN